MESESEAVALATANGRSKVPLHSLVPVCRAAVMAVSPDSGNVSKGGEVLASRRERVWIADNYEAARGYARPTTVSCAIGRRVETLRCGGNLLGFGNEEMVIVTGGGSVPF